VALSEKTLGSMSTHWSRIDMLLHPVVCVLQLGPEGFSTTRWYHIWGCQWRAKKSNSNWSIIII